MRCPFCECSFPLTWARYLGAPAGRHACPACGRRSRLRPGLSYWALLVLAASLGGIPPALALGWWPGGYWPVAGWAIGGLISGAAIDKTLLDAGWRKLERPEQAA
ncbi:MAG: hypothetical protein A3D95_13665 [Betaproteobacteria bacterium RIFCSPHIGHO2_12_FULL_69_13]|nr:MAG: hypothetical protein A3D95_13665 [Betaproteobacteria bacterium RIFCSPHIGHO2_12_FULL_69_13]OGA68487.1 MAG: hypothetical protein A3G83_03530 [Betaproteobacteria bacterium RIFCSPLOWO2_12_FULL_68_20]